MSKTEIYKGYTIEAAPQHLVYTGQWEVNVFISWSTKDAKVESRYFHSTIRHATKAEATAHSLTYGRQIIEGKIPGLSIPELLKPRSADE